MGTSATWRRPGLSDKAGTESETENSRAAPEQWQIILRPFLNDRKEKKRKKKKNNQKSVAFRLTYCPTLNTIQPKKQRNTD